MRKLKILNISLLISCIIALGIGFTASGRSYDIEFHHHGNLTQSVVAIFRDLGVDVSTLAQANEFAQTNLVRTGERWDKQAENELNTRIRENQSALLDHFKELNMVDAIEPQHKQYTYALIMGATHRVIVQRLDFLADLMQKGCAVEYIVMLGGERPLRDVEKVGLPETVTTEGQMMAHVATHHPQFADKKIILVNAPMIQKPDGTLKWPTFESTLHHFEQIAPYEGSCLVVSNNPYIIRPTKTAQRILKPSYFPIEGVGPALNIERTGILIVMDEFARILYEENLQLNARF